MEAPPMSYLFALPFELRLKIYNELLCPDPARVYTLYHDRQGREPSFGFHPQFLRVCKHANDEAAPVLYGGNIFELRLASAVHKSCRRRDPNHTPDPRPLLRLDNTRTDKTVPQLDLSTKSISAGEQEPYVELGRGIIFLHSLRRLRQIRLVISRSAIWSWGMRGPFFTETGKLIVRTLENLIGESSGSSQKVLELVVEPNWQTKYGIFQTGKTDAPDEMATRILALLQHIQRARRVKLEEKVFSNELGRLETKHVDIDSLMASLKGPPS